jgi:sulfate permease, SulP family
MLASLIPSRGDAFGGISAGASWRCPSASPLALQVLLGVLRLGESRRKLRLGSLLRSQSRGLGRRRAFTVRKVLVTGPTNPMTLVAATIVAANTLPNGSINLPIVVTAFLLAGALQVLLGVLRLGGFVRYVPYPVISGFMSGIGVIIIIQQLYPILGAEAPSSNPAAILGSLSLLPGRIVWPVAFLGLATFVIIQLLPRFTRKVPAALVALVVVTGISVALGVDARRIGHIPAGLPSLVVPDLTFDQITLVVLVAVELALLGAIDTLLSALLADSLTKSHHDSDRELIGQGIGNIGAALVGGLPGAGANIRTIVNIEAGGKTRLSGVIHGLFLLAVLLGLSGLVKYVPNAVLSGILVGAGLGCIDLRGLSHIAKVPRSDAAILVIVLTLTVFVGLVVAVAAGLIIASLVFMKKVADICERQTEISSLADEPWADEIDIAAGLRDRLLVKHVEGPLFFGFASSFLNIAGSAMGGRLLVLRMDRVSLMDQSGAYALQDALVNLASSGVRVVLVGLPVAQRDVLEAIHVIPDLVSPNDLFADFPRLKAALPNLLADIEAGQKGSASHLV